MRMGSIGSSSVLLFPHKLDKVLIELSHLLLCQIVVLDLANFLLINNACLEDHWLDIVLRLLHDVLVNMVLDQFFFALEVGEGQFADLRG
jgi:hypothetical protein